MYKYNDAFLQDDFELSLWIVLKIDTLKGRTKRINTQVGIKVMFGPINSYHDELCLRTEEFQASLILYPSLHIIQHSITNVHMSSSQSCSMITNMLRNRYIHRLRHRGVFKDASMDVTSDLLLLFGGWECKAGEWTRKSDIWVPPFCCAAFGTALLEFEVPVLLPSFRVNGSAAKL